MNEPRDYMTLNEFATTLGVTYETACRLIAQQRLAAVRLGVRWLVRRDVAAQFASQYDRETRGPKRWPGMRI